MKTVKATKSVKGISRKVPKQQKNQVGAGTGAGSSDDVRATAGRVIDGLSFQGPFIVTFSSQTIGASALPSIAIASGGLGGLLSGDITGFQKGGTNQSKLGLGHGSATLRRVKVGVRGGIKRQTLERRPGIKGEVRGKQSRAVGSTLYGAPDSRFACIVPWLDDGRYFEDRREFLQWAMGYERAEALPDVANSGALARLLQVPDVQFSYNIGARLLELGKAAAAKQARRLHELRGVQPSESSISDAQADAVYSVLACVRRLDKTTAQHWDNPRFVRVLRLYAARGAFNSLASWSVSGLTGDSTKRSKAFVSELTTELAQSLGEQDLAAGAVAPSVRFIPESQQTNESEQVARWSAVRWVYAVGLRDFKAGLPADMRGSARAAAVRAARARCRVLGAVLLGASFVDACTQPDGKPQSDGQCRPLFSSVANFVESCQGSGIFEALEASRIESGACACARGYRRYYAKRAASAIQALRALLPSSVWIQDGRGVFVATASQRAQSSRGARVLSDALQLRKLIDERTHCVAMAKHYGRVLRDNQQADARAFHRVLTGLKSGTFSSLRQAVGLVTVTKSGQVRERGASKVNSALLGRAKGKVARKRAARHLTTAVQIGKRALPCAVLAPESFETYKGA